MTLFLTTPSKKPSDKRMEKDLTILHISDLHFRDPSFGLSTLFSEGTLCSKQLIGWLNCRYRRGNMFSPNLFHKLIKRVLEEPWDYVVISGDITSLASQHEFKTARKHLSPIIKKGPVLFAAGNHDRYTHTSQECDFMGEFFKDCFPFNLPKDKNAPIHCIELNSSTVLFEINMAIPQSVIHSKGKVTVDLEKYQDLIQRRYKNHYKIAVGHFPVSLPEGIKEGYFHSLSNPDLMKSFLKRNQIDLYLHGHIHKSWHHQPEDTFPTLHINSGGCCRYAKGEQAGFHKITINGKTADIERIVVG